jgi:signal transduction histidine kinase
MTMRFSVPPPPKLPPGVGYGLAVATPLLALAVQLYWRAAIEHIPFVLFFFVVSFVASIGGWGPGIVSVVASAAGGYAFLATSSNPSLVDGALEGTAIFTPVAIVIAAFGALVREGFREREQANLELNRAIEARDRFISVASHELKTPLTALILSVHQLGRLAKHPESTPGERLGILHHAIDRQASRLTMLIDRLLDVSRLTSGHLDLTLTDVELTAVVEDVVEQFEPVLERVGSRLTVDTNARPVVGRWDRMRLEQVAANLVDNAIKYGAGKPIHVAVRRSGDQAELVVQDEGVGVPAGAQERIFGRFERAVADKGISGFGIGLWITREIVSALGGSVSVSSAEGGGSTFTVALPVRGPAPTPPSE